MSLTLIFLIITCGAHDALQEKLDAKTNNNNNNKILDDVYFECPFQPLCKCTKTTLLCDNFVSLGELKFSKNDFIFQTIIIHPKERIHFDDKFNATGLSTTQYANIILKNFAGFSYSITPLKDLNVTDNRRLLTLAIVNSTLEVLYNDMPLSLTCDYDFLSSVNESLLSFANNIKLVNTSFIRPICPLLFRNIKAVNLEFVLYNNEYNFMDISIASAQKMNTKISYFKISNATLLDVDSIAILNKHVLSAVSTVRFEHTKIMKINRNAFNELPLLKHLEFIDTNLDELIHHSYKWMSNLNNHSIVDIENAVEVKSLMRNKFKLFIRNIDYAFPNEDICYFKDFPHGHMVFNYIYPNEQLQCTCTLLWLLQYSYKYVFDHDMAWSKSKIGCSKFIGESLISKMKSCNFHEMFKKCHLRIMSDEDDRLETEKIYRPETTLMSLFFGSVTAFLIINLIARLRKSHLLYKLK